MFALIDVPETIRMHLAVGTSLTTIVATAAISTRAHHRRGAVDWSLLRSWWPWILLGTLAGTAVAGYVRSDVLIAVFASVALLVAIFMATTRPHFRLRDGLPRGFGKIVCAVLMDADRKSTRLNSS